MIVLDVENRRRDIDEPHGDLSLRAPAAAAVRAFAAPTRGGEKLYLDIVGSAETGVDLEFLTGSSGNRVAGESH